MGTMRPQRLKPCTATGRPARSEPLHRHAAGWAAEPAPDHRAGDLACRPSPLVPPGRVVLQRTGAGLQGTGPRQLLGRLSRAFSPATEHGSDPRRLHAAQPDPARTRRCGGVGSDAMPLGMPQHLTIQLQLSALHPGDADRHEVLLAAIAMEHRDLVLCPPPQSVDRNPDSPNRPVSMAIAVGGRGPKRPLCTPPDRGCPPRAPGARSSINCGTHPPHWIGLMGSLPCRTTRRWSRHLCPCLADTSPPPGASS